jgi:hypothetical protein
MKIKVKPVKYVQLNIGLYKKKLYKSPRAAAATYASWSNWYYATGPKGVKLSQAYLERRSDRLYRRVLPIFKEMLK